MKNVWTFSFECSGVVKVGGLAEAVFNMMNQLTKRGFNVTLFMPSHGIQTDSSLAQKLQLKKSKLKIEGKINGRSFLPYRKPFRYKIGVWQGRIKRIKIFLFGGLNEDSSKILDEKIVYAPDRIEDKALLLARAVKGCIENREELNLELPHILHAHDYHAIPAAVIAKQSLEKLDHKVALVLTIHLLSKNRVSWNYLNEKWCGINNEKHSVYLHGKKLIVTHKQLLRKARGYLEIFGAMESHIFTTVSRNYLEDEVMKFFGPSCECKKDFIWNGCDWKYEELLNEVYKQHGKAIKELYGKLNVERFQLREYFLTKAIAKLKPQEPILDEGPIKKKVYDLKKRPFLGRGKVEAFSSDGPMVLMTGRLSEQKGVDILFKAIPKVLRKVPDAKFVLLLLPTQDEIELIDTYAEETSKYRDSVRIIFGKAPSIYFLAHICSDTFACPSKWEPFGIMALEAMATGNPVIATKTGGLKETIIDLNEDPTNGTGILIPPKKHKNLADAIISLLAIMKIQERYLKGKLDEEEKGKIAELIKHERLRDIVLKNPSYGSKIRENCLKRVEEHFRWNKVIDMLIKVYQKAERIAKQV